MRGEYNELTFIIADVLLMLEYDIFPFIDLLFLASLRNE
jgi:hypothetical protein